MKITGVETILFEPQWDDPYPPRQRVFVAIKVHTDAGLVGLSRTWTPQVPIIHDYLTPVLLGQDPCNVERLWAAMCPTWGASRR